MTRRTRRSLAIALVILGILALGQGAWIPAKAWLAQRLLQRAWDATLLDGQIHRPWSWADHWPIARLRAPDHAVDLIVLEGDSGNVLAFAPGHAIASGLPEDGSTVVISGHRDTHFRFLQRLKQGDRLELEDRSGPHAYRVLESEVRDSRSDRITIDATDDSLLLVTCYPFDLPVAGGPLRYTVKAERVKS